MIDLEPVQLESVKQILREHVPGCEVWVFGSRVNGTPKPYSDLDVVVIGPDKLEIKCLFRLQEAFAESDLPIRVDVLDWHATADSFKRIIEQKYEVLRF